MLKGQIRFNKTSAPVEVSNIKSFCIVQNNNNVTIHEVNFERNGLSRRILFMNCIEATLNGSRYVLAQSNPAFCARLELTPAVE